MDMSLEEMNQCSIDMAIGVITDDVDESIKAVRSLYENIRNDFFLFAKRQIEIILFRLYVLKYYKVSQRLGAVDNQLYCMHTVLGIKYRLEVIRNLDRTFDLVKAREYLAGAMNAYKENNSEGEFEFMGKAALQGRADAAFNYGAMLMDGEGCEKDEFLGAFWYWQAAQMGYPGAMGNLACCYYNGRGVWQGKVRALYWFAFGAIELHKASIWNLGAMLSKGEVLSRDEATGSALKAISDAMEHGVDEKAEEYVRKTASAIQQAAAEWLAENEGGI